MSKKGNNTISVLFIILIIFIMIGFLGISIFKSGQTSKYFSKEDSSVAQPLYDKIMSLTEDNYPKTPEEVVSLYTDGYKLLYGDKIKDLSIVPNILEKQRLLFSEQLIAQNGLEEQTTAVLNNIENLKQNKVKITNITIKDTNYTNKNNTEATVKVVNQDNLFQIYYYIYYLEMEADQWKITGWYNTDENYNIITN